MRHRLAHIHTQHPSMSCDLFLHFGKIELRGPLDNEREGVVKKGLSMLVAGFGAPCRRGPSWLGEKALSGLLELRKFHTGLFLLGQIPRFYF